MTVRFSAWGAAALVAIGASQSAQATLFSFASDVNGNAFTFRGAAGSLGSFGINEFGRPNTHNLLIDDNNGVLPTLSIPVEFRADLTASRGQSTNLAGSLWLHSYLVTGSFGFYDAIGNPLLTVALGSITPALLTVPGTQNSWSSTGAVLGADTFSDVTYTATPGLVAAMGGAIAAAQYGVLGVFGNPADFGFDLTMINASSVGAAVGIDAVTKAPLAAWRSESSYSGSATGFIPSPGSFAMFSLIACTASVRNRRRSSL